MGILATDDRLCYTDRIWVKAAIAATTIVLLSSAAALAHTTDELDAWVAEWDSRLKSRGGLSLHHLGEYDDMATRHPVYFGKRVARPHTAVPHRTSPTSVAASGVEQWRPLIAAYFPADQVDRALRVMACESGGDPNADNPRSSASGLFQHLARYWDSRSTKAGWAGASIWDPEANIAVAAWLARTGGWSHWVCK